MAKTVRVTLEIPNEFIVQLRACCTMANYIAQCRDSLDDGPTSAALLAVMVLGEAMGQPEADQWAMVPPKWRDIAPDIIHDERRVYQDGKLIAGPMLSIQVATPSQPQPAAG